jgi:hypothetical protein
MQIGNSFIPPGAIKQRKQFFKLLDAGKFRGDFEAEWNKYKKIKPPKI